jgi:LacI family transcriptional regulator
MSRPAIVGLVLDTITAQRLAGGIFRGLGGGVDTRFIDAGRGPAELQARIEAWGADVLVVRWMPGWREVVEPVGLPVVLIGGQERGPGRTCVGVDNVRVGELAAEHLLERGHRHLAFVGKDYPFSHLRQEGFARALARRGLSCRALTLASEGWERYLEDWARPDPDLLRWLAESPRPLGLFAAQDPIGVRVLQACEQLGLRAPEDVAVVAANNDALACGLARPALTSVRIPWDRIGAEVARAVRSLLDGPAPERPSAVRVAPEGVVTRGSTDAFAVSDPVLARALRHVREHCGGPLDVPELARAAGVSRRRLEELFHQEGRGSPKREITRARMERAKELLARTDLDLARVSEACGYGYAARFSTVFREATGCTPSEFRRRLGSA